MIKTDNIIENEELENKWFMASQEYIDAMNDHYTEPDIEDPELSQTQIDKLKAVMDLKSGGHRVPFKTLCEALGIDYDQWKEDIEAGPPIDYIDEPLVSAVKNKVKPDNKKKPENFTTIEQDMLEVLLDD